MTDEITPTEETNQNQVPNEVVSAYTEAETTSAETAVIEPSAPDSAQAESGATGQTGGSEPIGSASLPAKETAPDSAEAESGAEPTNTETQTVSEPVPVAEAKLPQPQTTSPGNLARALLAKALQAVQFRKRKKLDKIMSLFEKRASITNDEVEKLLHVSDATATRYLSILEKENKIKQTEKKGRSVSYSKI